jgi:hypothetical protein
MPAVAYSSWSNRPSYIRRRLHTNCERELSGTVGVNLELQFAAVGHTTLLLVAFSARGRDISKRLVARQPKFDPQNPPVPRYPSQPPYAPLTNTPTGAFHLQPCQSYKGGSSSLLGVPNSKCHQQKRIYPTDVLRGKLQKRRTLIKSRALIKLGVPLHVWRKKRLTGVVNTISGSNGTVILYSVQWGGIQTAR